MATKNDAYLRTYREKRDFSKSSEPSGSQRAGDKSSARFVIQRHEASTLHFDFRLEVDGVLKSWAVPKGPSTDPSEKRLATETEDHPLEYADFEGSIPEGEYGAGTVSIWDSGSYQNITEQDGQQIPASEAIDSGHVKVELHGDRLSGAYALTRMRDRSNQTDWLLVKVADEAAERDHGGSGA